jgi:hypothetical protein
VREVATIFCRRESSNWWQRQILGGNAAVADCTPGHFQFHASQTARSPPEMSYLHARVAWIDTRIAFACVCDEQVS